MNRILERPFSILACVAGVAGLALGIAIWMFNNDREVDVSGQLEAPEAVAASFFIGLAALDVEENERAADVLAESVQREPREPALWANLAIAQLRLNEPEKARQSLQQALDLAGDSRELALLNAELLRYGGQIEPAMEQLRALHRVWPENVEATFSLVSLLAQIRDDAAEAERLELLTDLHRRLPGNLRILTELGRAAATMERAGELQSALRSLEERGAGWPESICEQLTQASDAASDQDFRQAAMSLTFLQNLLQSLPEYQRSLTQLGIQSATAVGTPLRSPLRLHIAAGQVAESDLNLTFEPTHPFGKTARPNFVLAMEHPGKRPPSLLSIVDQTLHVDGSTTLPVPAMASDGSSGGMCVVDLNFDFQQDLIWVGDQGCHVFLGSESGELKRAEIDLDEFDRSWKMVWPVDIEADGDIDLLLSDGVSPLRCVRNNGDMTLSVVESFPEVQGVVDLSRIDFDQDGDIDLIALSQSGDLVACRNERNAVFVTTPLFEGQQYLAIAIGDIDRDGQMDVVFINRAGELGTAHWGHEGWSESLLDLPAVPDTLDQANAAELHLSVADLDNNGGLDLIVSGPFGTAIWLQNTDASWSRLDQPLEMQVTSVVDYDKDGLLDLVGMSESGVTVAVNQSRANYGWHVLEPLANPFAGDKRFNSFGIGGRIEIRAGNLTQASTIDSPKVHFGLGSHPTIDVARITWPNGTAQAEFGLLSGDSFVANQRLKGSCPWVFTFDGNEFRFVKDFIWRSPLGLRINAQSTAGVTQTEDWIKLPGERLAEVDGRYQVRITAELWETHFFDHVSLLAVDRPADVELFVDERFIPQSEPTQNVVAVSPPQPLQDIADDRGVTLDEILASNDGVYADGFPLGPFQGVAENHWVEFNVPVDAGNDRPIMIVGHGWIYPTDSSINVALDQGGAVRPFGLILEQQQPNGEWLTIDDQLGFPAGKNKNVLLPIPSESLTVSRRFRLRTNMEVYWDSLRWSHVLDSMEPRTIPLKATQAELRYRGYSKLLPEHRRRPDTPVYEIAGKQRRWLDLEGFYTRFGDVRELLESTDDRYVIMNAGDELVLEFAAIDEPAAGWKRDFILVGDGWVKDGDFNTAFSKTVRPLPTHANSEYLGPAVDLQDDAVYQQHAGDWRRYHTRYVHPDSFHQSLWRPNPTVPTGKSQP